MSKNTVKQVKTRKEMTKAQWTWFLIRKNKMAYMMVAPPEITATSSEKKIAACSLPKPFSSMA